MIQWSVRWEDKEECIIHLRIVPYHFLWTLSMLFTEAGRAETGYCCFLLSELFLPVFSLCRNWQAVPVVRTCAAVLVSAVWSVGWTLIHCTVLICLLTLVHSVHWTKSSQGERGQGGTVENTLFSCLSFYFFNLGNKAKEVSGIWTKVT